ncbi:MAG TPA: BON domain-containing protein [Burkholderiales bacterium]|jgi:osmotically-inducible protein OsmY|nr:BON domain-containing protein [Burkholderiales bacterium]
MKSVKRITAVLAAAALFAAAGCASEGEKQSSAGAYIDDAAITTRVKTAIFNEPSLKLFDIGVTTEAKVVHLTGSVKTRAEMAKAVELARKVQGVKSVKNELKLKQ